MGRRFSYVRWRAQSDNGIVDLVIAVGKPSAVNNIRKENG